MRKRSAIVACLAVALTAGVLVLPTPAGAVIQGEIVSGSSWSVYVNTAGGGSCSGALVAPEWVLTAAHCVATLDANMNDYVVDRPNRISVEVGRTNDKNRGERRGVRSIETRRYRGLADPARNDDDVALLRLDRAVTLQPLWVLPSSSLATNGTDVNLFGYGHTATANQVKSAKSKTGTLRKTSDGENELYPDCVGATDGIVCVRDTGDSLGAGGDSGAPWVMHVDGAPVLTLVFSGYVTDSGANQQWAYGESVYNDATLGWIRSHLGIPTAVPGRIVRDPATAESWLIDGDGFRRPIADGGTYQCLVEAGAPVVNLPRASLDLMAARTQPAACGGGDVFLFFLEVESGDEVAVPPVLEAAGYSVTVGTTLPPNLDSFEQVWVFSTYHGYPSEVRDALISYVLAGGSLLMNSEHACCPTTNADAEQIMDGILTVDVLVETVCSDPCQGAPEPIEPGAFGGIGTTPNSDVSLATNAVGRYSGVPSENALLMHNGQVGATVWGPEHTRSGIGRLVTVADSNWTDSGWLETYNVPFAENVAAYLAG